jgi:elongation factor G
MDFPNPVIEMKIEPKTKADQEKMSMALSTMALEDPSFRVAVDQESGETILRGMGELHLDIKVDILKRTYGVEANVGAPQVAYRETLVKAADIDYTHKKQTGGTGQFARVKLRLEPNETGKGNEFESEVVGGTVPKEYIPGVEKGINSVWDSGVLIGFPMVDTKVTLWDGAFHEVDSSAIAFEIAARSAMREGCDKAGVKLLEPIMDVEVVTPEAFVGGVIGDINSRRGQIRSQEMRGNANVIRAFVPLANMFGYVSQLRSMSQGRASYTMQFGHYADVPRNVADEVKAKYA